MTRELWLEWVNHPVTLAVNEAVKQRINESKDQLANPDSDSDRDRFLKGMIWAFSEVLDAKPDIIDEEFVDEVFSGDAS